MSHILLIDDDPDFSAALAAEMRYAGHRVTCASSCAEGIDALSAVAYEDRDVDAVLVDMFMPDADGFETIHALRDIGIDAPVIAISGGCSRRPDGVLNWARSLGADASLAKPFEIDRLITLVDRMHGQCGVS
ncbi:MAG: response regulator [Alphaproteobacteria bacterium]|nr:response regulator [Alphaproteobacteria bacterium]